MLERRLATSERSQPTDEPGLVLGDDGIVYEVASDGSGVRTAIGNAGGSSALGIVTAATLEITAVAPATPVFQPVPFDTVIFDPGNLWDAEAFAFSITEAGWYECGVYGRGGATINTDNCEPLGVIQVNGAGDNIISDSPYQSLGDSAARLLPTWSGITHLTAGDSVELDMFTGSSVGTEEEPSLLSLAKLTFYVRLLYPT